MGRLSKAKWCSLGCLIILLVLLAGSVFVPNRLTDAVGWVANNELANKIRVFTQQEEVRKEGLIEMVVETVGVSKIEYQPVVILKERDGEIYLPIVIGLFEANAISVVLEGVKMPRPLTPDLLCSIINRIGASVDYIVVNDLRNQTFYATIILSANWGQMEIDARPSDAIAVALRVGVPIYAKMVVLEKAGIQPEHKIEEYSTMPVEKDNPRSVAKYLTLHRLGD